MPVVKSLEDICLNFFMKNCDLEEYEIQSLYCYTDESSVTACETFFLICKCPNWQNKSELNNFRDWCLLYKDMCTYSGEFTEINFCSKFIKKGVLIFCQDIKLLEFCK